jgi:hypothetical protein
LGTVQEIATKSATPFLENKRGNCYRLIARDSFTKWPEVYTIYNQGASVVADALVSNFFCCFRILRDLHSNQGQNFVSEHMQEVLITLRISKTWTTPLLLLTAGWNTVRTVQELLRKVILLSQRD